MTLPKSGYKINFQYAKDAVRKETKSCSGKISSETKDVKYSTETLHRWAIVACKICHK